jgi:hypothetical protein
MMPDAVDIAFAPLVPWSAIAAFAVVTGGLAIYGLARGANGGWWRLLATLVVALALANPSLVAEDREPRADVAVVVIDRSASQDLADRPDRSAEIVAELRERLGRLDDLEIREVALTPPAVAADGEAGTRLFARLGEVLSDIPRRRLAGIFVITDGQIHDATEAAARNDLPGPLHVLLSGRRDEFDRRIVIERAPTFGMVGKTVSLRIRIEDEHVPAGTPIPLTLRVDGVPRPPIPIDAGVSTEIELEIDHGGETIVELIAETAPGELTDRNNRTVVSMNGVRDRLRVLLVSGEPHAGERTWRDLLTADPSVDLVHFTILRPPEKQYGTPIRELSLIAFPIRELFELKLEEFDLIVFDRYRRRGVLSRLYLSNIVEYVRNGGALLEASGPAFAGRLSLALSPLAQVLPAEPTGEVIERGFKPELTAYGRRHPVTASLTGAGAEGETPQWGRWFRTVDAIAERGTVLISGPDDRPVLVLDRVGQGRVAHLLSDHVWLWSRGFEGGGPQAEMLRRTAHWLMGEPDLEEDDLRATVTGETIDITRRALAEVFPPVTVTTPSGTSSRVELERRGPGLAGATLPIGETGLYRLDDGDLTRLVAVGELNPIEFADTRTTSTSLRPIVEKAGGAVFWAIEDGLPAVRRVRPERAVAGTDWAGLVRNDDYDLRGIETVPLMPPWLVLLLTVGGMMLAWRREGQ